LGCICIIRVIIWRITGCWVIASTGIVRTLRTSATTRAKH